MRFTRVVKIGLILIFSEIICACSPSVISQPSVWQTSEFVMLIPSSQQQDFSFDEKSQAFVNDDGTELRIYLRRLVRSGIRFLRLIPSSVRADATARKLVAELRHNQGTSSTITKMPRIIDKTVAELRVDITRYGMQFADCRTGGERIRFGCSVEINRALSLADPAELEFGRNLSMPLGQTEYRALKRYLGGKTAPFRETKQ